VDQALALLRQRGRLTYRTIQLQFQLDDAHLPLPHFTLSCGLPSQILTGNMDGDDYRGVAMDWKYLLAYITGTVDQELLLRNEYLVAENRILRHQLKGRIQLSDGERKALAVIGQRLGKQALKAVAQIAKPETILAWHPASISSRTATPNSAQRFNTSSMMPVSSASFYHPGHPT